MTNIPTRRQEIRGLQRICGLATLLSANSNDDHDDDDQMRQQQQQQQPRRRQRQRQDKRSPSSSLLSLLADQRGQLSIVTRLSSLPLFIATTTTTTITTTNATMSGLHNKSPPNTTKLPKNSPDNHRISGDPRTSCRESHATIANLVRSSSSSSSSRGPSLEEGHNLGGILSIRNIQQMQPPPKRQLNYLHLPRHHLALISCLIIIIISSVLNSASGQQLQQQQPQQAILPTVIVRGFLNYRTTVDGTVLLFTPDAGNQPTASVVQSTSATMIAPTATVAAPIAAPSSTYQLVELASVQPSVAQLGPASTARAQEQAVAAAADEWRPIQATPPLRPQGQPSDQADTLIVTSSPTSSSSSSSASTSTEASSRPTVQADDLASEPKDDPRQAPASTPSSTTTSTTTTTTAASTTTTASEPVPSGPPTLRGRPKRPPLGFSGQALRGRQVGLGASTSAAPSSSSSPNSSPNSNSGDSTAQAQPLARQSNTINGIRRPGMNNGWPAATTASTPSSQPTASNPNSATSLSAPSNSSAGINVGNAFQNRLTTANQRLKNRFKHRNNNNNNSNGNGAPPVAAAPSSVPAGAAPAVAPPQLAALVPPNDRGATTSQLLDVASIEQPLAVSPGRLGAEPSPLNSGPMDHHHHHHQLQHQNQGPSALPVVGSDEILISAAASPSPANPPASGSGSATPIIEADLSLVEPVSAEQEAGLKPLSRAGEQRPSSAAAAADGESSSPRLISGKLQQGQLSSGPLNFDALFQNDQPPQQQQQLAPSAGDQAAPSEHQVSHQAKEMSSRAGLQASGTSSSKKSQNNEKLSGWLAEHHNKFVPRPASSPGDQAGHLSHQLASNPSLQQQQQQPQQLLPSFASNLASINQATEANNKLASGGGQPPTPPIESTVGHKPAVGDSDGESDATADSGASNVTASHPRHELATNNSSGGISLQTITRTYSTTMTALKTRLVPLQVRSSTAIHTITEEYVITKVLTAYQTLPQGAEFILAEPTQTRAPFELFNEPSVSSGDGDPSKQPVGSSNAPAAPAVIVAPPVDVQEQPISLDSSPKSANDWLHDFTSGSSNDLDSSNRSNQQQQQQQLANLLLEQQAREANLASQFGLGAGEPLDQLASSLDPAALLADGTINIPDLNNPIVLAAAIQNPQLAAVILAAQQLQLKQRQNKLAGNANNGANGINNNNNIQPAIQLQPSYSTSLSTTIRPSTYTVRDTMFTTRLVSFKDGRTVRTRTVSEPGSVVEQVLTTMATEVTPVTITIRPTGTLALQSAGATSLPGGGGGGGPSSSPQSTINNALIATQLASLLARRQQQLQPSLMGPLGGVSNQNPFGPQASATPQQLLAFQQLLQQQQQLRNANSQQAAASAPSGAKQFQPNFQQLLQSLQQQQSAAINSGPQRQDNNNNNNNGNRSSGKPANPNDAIVAPTPSLPSVPSAIAALQQPSGPITTTLTSLQVRTYTVHNAFKTIFRTITSTQLLTSTIYPNGVQPQPPARSTQQPMLG